MKTLRVISLFTGAGGLDLGFEAAGFETAVAVEMDGRCVKTLRANRYWPIIDRDIASVTSEELLEKGCLAPAEADVLIGGPPCQPFSKSGFWANGEARRLDDPRASTIDHFLRILGETRPKTFLLENVEGLGFRGKDEGLTRIRSAIEAINILHSTSYDPEVAVLSAADYGVPQVRRRLFVIGSRDGTRFRFPKPTHSNPLTELGLHDGPRWRTAWDALHDLPAPQAAGLDLQGKWADLLPSIPEGQNYLHHTERGAGEPLFGWRRRYWSFLLKLAKNQPAWTLQAQPGPATGPFHWLNRRLSMREMARLQTFPDNFEVLGSIADAQRQLGNAVPALLAEILARAMRSELLGSSPITSGPRLSIKAAKAIPAPEPVAPVAPQYLRLRGDYAAHPGTGKGYRATTQGRTLREAC